MPISAVMAADTCCNVMTPEAATTFGGTPIVCSAKTSCSILSVTASFLMKLRERANYLTQRHPVLRKLA